MIRFLINISVLIILLAGGCSKMVRYTTPSVTRNVASIYKPSSSPLHPEFIVYHERPEVSRLYIKLFTQELLFNQANREGKYMGSLKVHYELREVINGNDSETIADSATISYSLDRNAIKEVFFASIPFIAFQDKIYSIYVKYYRNTFPFPRPPVTNLTSTRPEFIPDSIFPYLYRDTISYRLPYEGMYHIQVDPEQQGGLTLFNFGDSYPRVTTIDEMIGPLAFLTSTVEFNDLINQTNKKLALDNFWLQTTGNVETSRELIRIYYNRVFFANYYFSSYKEGWKTDRGMMFIIYGPPNPLTKAAETEIWTYYRKRGKEPLRFTFSKVSNPYSDNDYQMERDFVNSMWLQAVADWRKGKVFYTDKL